MKKYRWMLALLVLALAMLACQTVMGGRSKPTETPPTAEQRPAATEPVSSGGDETSAATATPPESQDSTTVSSKFPLPDDAANIMDFGEGVNFQTKMSLDEAMKFYRDAFGKQGLKERDILTVTTDTTFNLVFDGDPSGKAVVIQGVDLGNDTINVSILLEDV